MTRVQKVQLVPLARRVLKALRDPRGRQALSEPLVSLDRLDPPGRPEGKALPGFRDPQVRRALSGLPEVRALRDLRGSQGLPEVRVLRACPDSPVDGWSGSGTLSSIR